MCLVMDGYGCRSSPPLRPPMLVQAPAANPLPEPTAPPDCALGALVTTARVCGLGVAGRAYRWNDPKMQALARRRAAENLAGMLRAVVTSALIVEQTEDTLWTREERYLEIDETLVDEIEGSADIDVWFDVLGVGPFREAERTYACACLSTMDAGIKIDPLQVEKHGFVKQYAVEEVPSWLLDAERQNTSLRCAVGFHSRMYHPEEILEPLVDSVRVQLMQTTRSWILSQFDDQAICAHESKHGCRMLLASLIEAANEGLSRGVALTSVWFDPLGLGPSEEKMSAYGWGCVYDAVLLRAARTRLEELKAEGLLKREPYANSE